MAQEVDLTIEGYARPNRLNKLTIPYPVYLYAIEIEGAYSEYSIFDGNRLTTRDSTNMEFPEPVHVTDPYLQVAASGVLKYRILATRAK